MTTLELVTWIAGGLMFGAFAIEGLTSYFLLRDGRYAIKDTATSVAITIGYVVTRLGVGAVVAVIFLAVWEATPLRWSMDAWWHWLVLLVATDFFYYWSHRASHTYRFMWASHAVHHNSRHLNLSTGLRNSWTGGAIDWVFLVPIVAIGFHPLYLGAMLAITQTWDFLTHTPYVGKARWLDAIFNSPSNHRVHHATNPRYLDKNLGGMLIVWDRMFGTYAAEDDREPVVIGAVEPVRRPHDPVYVELYVWGQLFRDLFARRATREPPARSSPHSTP